jgi:hypothetical protein
MNNYKSKHSGFQLPSHDLPEVPLKELETTDNVIKFRNTEHAIWMNGNITLNPINKHNENVLI